MMATNAQRRKDILALARRLYGPEATLNEDTLTAAEARRKGIPVRHFAWIQWPGSNEHEQPTGDGVDTLNEALANLFAELDAMERRSDEMLGERGNRRAEAGRR